MDFFDKLGKKASEAYKITADKTGKIAKEAKLRMKINELKSQINDIYEEIGKKVYENHVREEKEDLGKILEEECIRIDVLSDEIEDKLHQCLELKDKKQCPNCYKEIDKNMKFCPECGAKQKDEDTSVKEVEILDIKSDDINTNTQNENKDNIEIKEEYNSDTQDNDNMSKENIENQENNFSSNESDEQNKSNLAKTVELESNPQIVEGEELSEEQIKNLYREEDKFENS